jgi:3-deoxy-D-manno-octulosonate 8-phosphate phosphatase (KDO 8-P phosphatase)
MPSLRKDKKARLLLRARKIRFLLLDVDGILTDGTIWIDDQGREMKGFSIYDGHGIRLLQEAGLEVGLLSGRASNVVTIRAKELGIREVHQGVRDKIKVYEELIGRLGLSDNEVAYMGDDLIDLPILKRVGLSVSVPNAVPSAIKSAEWVTRRKGGEGAVREVTDLLLEARKK